MPRASSQRRRNGSLTRADQVLELQRAIGNRATVLAIQRAGTAAPEEIPLEDLTPQPTAAAETAPAPAPQRESLPKATAEDHFLTSKEQGGRIGQSLPPAASETGAIGSVISYAAKPAGHSVPTNAKLYATGQGTSLSGSIAGFLGDMFTLGNKGGELHDARKDAKAAEGSGSAFWKKAAGRQKRIKRADVGVASAKIALGDIPKLASASTSVAGSAGASAAGIAAGAMALPVSIVSTLRDAKKLYTQAARMRRMNQRLLDSSAANSVGEAQQRMAEVDEQVRVGRERVALATQPVINAEESLRVHRDFVWQHSADADQRQLEEAISLFSEADALLPQAKQALKNYEEALAEAEARQKQIHEAYGPMAAAVRDMAGEVAKLDKGEAPSLKTIAYYSKVKNAKGSIRRAVKVISGTLGVAAGVVALVALVSGPAAVAIGPAAVVLGMVGASLGLALAAETGWRFLSKRWARTKDAYVEVGPGKGKEGPVQYKQLTKRSERFMATMSFKTKLYEKVGEEEYKERKSHRKIMAAALWDYATDDKYAPSVRTEAWAVIRDLTGRSQEEIVTLGPDAPNGRFTNETVREGQKAAALKLFEDKLKSA